MVSVKVLNFIAASVVLSVVGASSAPFPAVYSSKLFHPHSPSLSLSGGARLAARNNKYLDAAWAGAKAAGKSLLDERDLELLVDRKNKYPKAAGHSLLDERDVLEQRRDLEFLVDRNNKYLDAAWAGAKAAGKSLIEDRALEEERGLFTEAAMDVGKAAFEGGKAAYKALHNSRALAGDLNLNSLNARGLDMDIQHLVARGGFCNAVHAGVQAAGNSLLNSRDLQELQSREARRGLCDAVVAGAKAAGNSLLHSRDLEAFDLYAM